METISIVRGNDFRLRIPIKRHVLQPGGTIVEEDFAIEDARPLKVFLEGCDCHAIELDWVEDEEHESSIICDVNGLIPLGTYHLIVAGKRSDGAKFRSKERRQLRIVENNERANIWPIQYDGFEAYSLDTMIILDCRGRDGLSAYEIACINGFKGTETQWLKELAIKRIDKTSTDYLTDTYTITYSNGATSTFQINNGESAYQAAVRLGKFVGTEEEWATYARWPEVDALVDHTLRDMDVNVDETDVEEPASADMDYDEERDPKLQLNLHNIKGRRGETGNGITSITQTTVATGDGSVNVVNIKTNDNPNGVNIEIRNGTQGIPGADRQPVEEGDVIIAHTMGESDEMVMSQKAVTDELYDIKDFVHVAYGDITQAVTTVRGNIYNDKWYTIKTGSGDVTYGAGRDLALTSYKGETIELTPQSGKTMYFAFIDTHGTTGNPVSYVPDSGGLHTATEKTRLVIPNAEGNVFMWVCTIRNGVDVIPTSIRIVRDLHDVFDTMKTDVANLKSENAVELASYDSDAIYAWTQCWWLTTNNTYTSSTAKGRTIPISSYRGKTLTIKARSGVSTVYALLKSLPTSTSSPFDPCDDTGRTSITGGATIQVVVPNDANYLYVEYNTSASSYTYPEKVTFTGSLQSTLEDVYEEVQKAVGITAIHVNESTGSNDNDGLTAETAVATLSKALSMQGIDARIILHGNTTGRLSISGKRRVVVTNARGEKATITRGVHITEAEQDVETGIYSYDMTNDAAATFDKGQSLASYWIYQDGIPDASTLISDAERHPLHRGKTYRCDSARMTRYTSMASLQADDSGVPAYYYDTTNKVLYFKIATNSSLATNPVVIPKYNDYAIYASGCEVHLEGIDCRYGYIFLSNCDNSTLTDCSAKYSVGGQNDFCGNIVWMSGRGITFTRCEAARCTAALNNATGDGFNAHIFETQDSRDVRRMTATMIDCWAHDCIDDGYSDHGRSEVTVIGGVFEYNDCGIANATGACDTLYNVIMRRNVTCGVRLGGTVSSETNIGKGTSVTCFGCFAENNNDSGYRCGISSSDGTTSLPNVLTCYNCISVANNRGFRSSNTTGCKMYLYNCSDSGSTAPVTNATTAISATPITT